VDPTKPVTPVKPATCTSDEWKCAYDYAFSKGVTTMDTYAKARVNDTVTRIDLAKMLAQYSMNVLGNKLPAASSKDCSAFEEFIAAYKGTDLYDNAYYACQLGIMGINPDGTALKDFRPNDKVIRAEFATAFSRMLWGNKYEGRTPYYLGHIEALRNVKVITDDNPNLVELRGYIFLQLFRAASNVL
jgi:hypothetical protein